MIEASDTILSLADGETKIIPGHGPLGDRKQLQEYRDMLKTAYDALSETVWAHRDLAILLEDASDRAHEARRSKEARRARLLAADQWHLLGEPDRAASCASWSPG